MAKSVICVEEFGLNESGLVDTCIHFSDGSVKSIEVAQDIVVMLSAIAEQYN